jgi:hypothetical protein
MTNATEAFGNNIDEAVPGLPPITPDYVRVQPEYSAPSDKAPNTYAEPRVRIILEEQEGIPPSGQFFGINGNGYILKPGRPADVPVGIVDILNHAIQETPVVDEETMKVLRFRKQLRLPYRVIRHIPAHSPIPPMESFE